MSGTQNNSANPGYLTPFTNLPLDGLSFDQFIQSVVAGILGFQGQYVRPRWQPGQPPEIPPQGTNWCAVGELASHRQGFPSAVFIGSDNDNMGAQTNTSSSLVDYMASFYGPDAYAYASLLQDGLAVQQNRDMLIAENVNVADIGDEIVRVPELVNTIWMDRADLQFVFSRIKNRTYNIYSVVSAIGTITTQDTNSSFTTLPE